MGRRTTSVGSVSSTAIPSPTSGSTSRGSIPTSRPTSARSAEPSSSLRLHSRWDINQNNQAPGPGNLYELAADLSLSFKKEIYGGEVRLRSRVSLLILWLNGQIYQQIVLEGDCSLLWNQTCPACALTMYMLYKTKPLWYTEHFKNLIEIRLLGNYHCRMVFVYYDIEYCMCCEQNLKYWCCIF